MAIEDDTGGIPEWSGATVVEADEITPIRDPPENDHARALEDAHRDGRHVGYEQGRARYRAALIEVNAEAGSTLEEMSRLLDRLERLSADRRRR